MKVVLIAVGALLMLFGAVDLIGSFAGFDLWYEIGIELPEIIWRYSAYIELVIGYVILKAGLGAKSDDAEVEDA